MQIDGEDKLRNDVQVLPFLWAEERGRPFTGEHREHYVEMIRAADIVHRESQLGLRRAVDMGRLTGMSWLRIGLALGISKQAAQQRFRSIPNKSG